MVDTFTERVQEDINALARIGGCKRFDVTDEDVKGFENMKVSECTDLVIALRKHKERVRKLTK